MAASTLPSGASTWMWVPVCMSAPRYGPRKCTRSMACSKKPPGDGTWLSASPCAAQAGGMPSSRDTGRTLGVSGTNSLPPGNTGSTCTWRAAGLCWRAALRSRAGSTSGSCTTPSCTGVELSRRSPCASSTAKRSKVGSAACMASRRRRVWATSCGAPSSASAAIRAIKWPLSTACTRLSCRLDATAACWLRAASHSWSSCDCKRWLVNHQDSASAVSTSTGGAQRSSGQPEIAPPTRPSAAP